VFESWFKLFAAGADMAQAAVRTGEAVAAADRVIRRRSDTIARAVQNPVAADYAELGRLIPEKLAASSRATSDVLAESWKIWTEAGRSWQAMWSSGMTGAKMLDTSTDLMTRSMGLYGMALDPFHAAVTRNDRRLKRKH
jgi:hypothetical protein